MDFFTEFEQLKLKKFRTGGYSSNNINSDYTYNTKSLKNCYLISNAITNEDCMYGRDFYDNSDCVDCDHILRCTLCYEVVNSKECWDCSYILDCTNCANCDYGYDLKDCKNCVGCAGLRKKEFHIFNVPYSKEEFLQKKKSLGMTEIKKNFEDLQLRVPRLYSLQINTENCIGDYIHNSKNIFCGFDLVECQDCGYIEESKKCFDCWNISILEESTSCCHISSSHSLNNCNFCFLCAWSSDLEFCEWVMNSKNCFGCISLNHAEYCILNRQYTREEYFKRVTEIKNELKKEGDYGARFWSPTFPLEDTVATWPRL